MSVRLSHYSRLRNERDGIAAYYLNNINNPKVELPKIRNGAEHVWHLFVVRTAERDQLQKYLMDNLIGTGIHYPIPPHLSEAYSYLKFKKGDFPITEEYANTSLSLPIYEGMTEMETKYVVEMINNFL